MQRILAMLCWENEMFPNKSLRHAVFASASLLFCTQVAWAQSCTWPMQASVLVQNTSYPTWTNLVFKKHPQEDDLIQIVESTLVDISPLVMEYPAIVQRSKEFQAARGLENCNKRADDFAYSLTERGGYLYASVAMRVEYHWCTSADVPCPLTLEPFRLCRKEANGRVWGARIRSVAKLGLEMESHTLEVKTLDVQTTNNTSVEQNFVRDLVDSFPVPHGLARGFERDVFRKINQGLESGFRGIDFTLDGGGTVPEIPNYDPVVSETKFVTRQGANGDFIGARVVRTQEEYPAATGCFVARQMLARPMVSGSRGARNP